MKLVLVLLNLLTISLFCLANQPVPEQLPIGSTEVLTAYAKAQVNRLQGGFATLTTSSGFSVKYTGRRGDTTAMAAVVVSQKIEIDAEDSAAITGYVTYIAETLGYSWAIFDGSSSIKRHYDTIKKSWIVDSAAVNLKLSDRIPVRMPGIISATATIRDQSWEQYWSLDTEGRVDQKHGVLLIGGVTSIDHTGELIIKRRNDDGVIETVLYNLKDGKRIPTSPITATLQPSVPGIKVLPDNTENIVYRIRTGPCEECQETSDLITVTYTKDTVVTIDAAVILEVGTTETPTEALIIDENVYFDDIDFGDQSTWYSFPMKNGKSESFQIDHGQTILIRFNWPTFGKPQWSQNQKG